MYKQVQTLFRDAPDLLAEFKGFLPSANLNGMMARNAQTLYGNNNGEFWNIIDATADTDKRLTKGPDVGPSSGTPGVTKRRKRPDREPVPLAPPAVQAPPVTNRGTARVRAFSSCEKKHAHIFTLLQTKKLKNAHKAEPPASPGFAPYQSHPPSPAPEHVRMQQTYGHGPSWGPGMQPPAGPSTSNLQNIPLPPPPSGQSQRDELAFFDRARRVLEARDTYDDFLKLLDMFTKEIIDVRALLERVDPILGDTELMTQFKSLVGWDEKKESGQSGPPGAIRMYPQSYSTAYEENGERHGPSYRRLPIEVTACRSFDEWCWLTCLELGTNTGVFGA